MSEIDQTMQMMIIILIGAFIALAILGTIYFMLNRKNKNQGRKQVRSSTSNEKTIDTNKSVFDFLEFDKVEDNMIVQKNGKKFIMAIECQGVNYDLMSEIEKTGVEEGFVQFLNILRFPIQIYIQTRTVNLGNSLNSYKVRIEEIQKDLNRLKLEYEEMIREDIYSKEEISKKYFEYTKQNNLYEYGKDVIFNTEKMSLNKNILNKKYFLVISYYADEIDKQDYDNTEIQSMAFSELYTKAQTLIRALAPCGILAKVLNSEELIELLYIAYNRDESEAFSIKEATRAQYDRLYSTAPDVIEKKVRQLDELIERRAIEGVTEKIEKYRSIHRKKLEEKENSFDQLADEMARIILAQNKNVIGKEVAEEILEKEYSKRGGKKVNERKTDKTRKSESDK